MTEKFSMKQNIATDIPVSCCGVYLNFLERLQFLRDKRKLVEEKGVEHELVNKLEV